MWPFPNKQEQKPAEELLCKIYSDMKKKRDVAETLEKELEKALMRNPEYSAYSRLIDSLVAEVRLKNLISAYTTGRTHTEEHEKACLISYLRTVLIAERGKLRDEILSRCK